MLPFLCGKTQNKTPFANATDIAIKADRIPKKKIKRLTNFNDIKLFFDNKKIGGLPIFLCRFDFSKIRII